MILREKQIETEIAKIYKRIIKTERNCQVVNCKRRAINSHVLSKSKILKPISTNGHLREISSNNYRYRGKKISFVKTGLNEIMSFKCFCKEHDNKIFEDIESSNFDFYKEENQILLLVRSVFFEKYKKEVNVRLFRELLKKRYLTNREEIDLYISHTELGIQDMNQYINSLNAQYRGKSKDYIFYTFELPREEVVMSGIFHVEREEDIIYTEEGKINPQLPNSIIVSYFPFNEVSYLICGFQVKHLENLRFINWMKDVDTRMKIISDIMIERLETWAVSEPFYEEKIKKREQQFLVEFSKIPDRFLVKSGLKFYLFE